MPDSLSRDGTLPAIATGPTTTREWYGLYLTVIFHPDPQQIGAVYPLFPDGASRDTLGRLHPCFALPGQPGGLPLAEPHLSRLALNLQVRPDGLRLSRPEDASRCLVDGAALSGSVTLSAARLAAGVTLQLAHSVVLFLRQQPRAAAELPAVAAGEGLQGGSQSMLLLRQTIHRCAGVDRDVLIMGESGSGKEGVARALHRASRRAEGPWVAVNMSAIPVGVAAAELFGSERGAFTGADRKRSGYFQRAEGGTLFLDEVGDTPAEIQPLLLRALQEREIQPVGGEVRRVDLRVVAATELDLDSGEQGFRSSLRYRLAALEIRVPPLREHPEDIGELLCRALRQSCMEIGQPFPLDGLAEDPRRVARWANLFARCMQYPWPGNVRELLSCARQLALNAERGPLLPGMLVGRQGGGVREPEGYLDRQAEAEASSPVAPVVAPPARLNNRELLALLERHDYQLAAVARAAGLSRPALYRRLPDLGVQLVRDIPEAQVNRVLADCAGDTAAAARVLKVSRAALQARVSGKGGLDRRGG